MTVPLAPRYLGLAQLAAGVVPLSDFLVQCHRVAVHPWGPDYREVAGIQPEPSTVSSVWVVPIVVLIGAFTFGAVLAQMV